MRSLQEFSPDSSGRFQCFYWCFKSTQLLSLTTTAMEFPKKFMYQSKNHFSSKPEYERMSFNSSWKKFFWQHINRQTKWLIGNTRGVDEAIEDLNRRITATAQRLRRSKQRVLQFHQNNLFQNDTKNSTDHWDHR